MIPVKPTCAWKMSLFRVALCSAITLPAICSFAQKVHVEREKGIDFCSFNTYAWHDSKHPANEFWAARVTTAIDRELVRKGLKKVDRDESPDLEIVYNADIKERTTSAGCDYGCILAEYLLNQVYGPPWLWPEPGSWVSEVERNGSLVVGLVNASGRDMVWRAIAKGSLSDKTEENERKLNKAITKMFKKYPRKTERRCKGENR